MILRRISLLGDTCEKPEYIAPVAKSLTYNGDSQELLIAGSTNDGTIYYSLDDSTWGVAVPSGINASSYTVYWKLVANEGYCDIRSEINVTIAKVTPTIIAPTAKVLTYNGSAQELVNAGSTDYGTLQYKVSSDSWSTSIPTRTRGGNYTVQYRVIGDSNINDVAAQSVQCSINEKQVTATVTLSQTAYTYNGSPCEPSVTVSDDGVVIDPSEYTVTYSNNVNAGTGTVTISDNVGGNYEVIGSSTFTINKANPTYTAPTATSPTYNGTAQYLLNAGSTSHGTIQYSSDNSTWNTTIPTGTNASTYTSYWRLIGDSNHNNVSSTSISTTIAKANSSLSFTVTNITVVVGGTSSNIVTVNAGNGTVTYSSNNASAVTVDNNGSITGVSVGNVVITANISSTSNYNSASTSYTSSCVEAIRAKFNVTSTSSPTKILSSTTNVSKVYIDGVEQQYVTTGYTFSTTGEHTVEYLLTDPTSIGNNTFAGCYSLTNCIIPSSVTSIGANAFSGMNLTSITIPSGVTTIGNRAFYRNWSIKNITMEATTPPTLGTSAFGDTNNCPIFVPTCNLVDTYKTASTWSAYSSRVSALDCPSITATFNVTNTSNPTIIAYSTTNFSSIEIDGVVQPSVTTGYTFDTTGEHTVKFVMKDFTTIDYNTFSGCTSLTNIDIPDSVTSIGDGAFQKCSGLTSCTIGNGVTTIGRYAFYNCSGLTSIEIPSGVTSIGESAFNGCRSLSSCTIGSGVTSIGESAFSGCTSLTSIDIPDSVTSIGGSAFTNCTSLTSIDIPDSVTSIGNSAFSGCSSLTSCTISGGSIGSCAFSYCSSLTSCTIGSGVTSIGYSAFTSCSGLTSITVNATTPPTLSSSAIGANVFIFVPTCSLVDTYKAASGWSTYASKISSLDCPPITTTFNVTDTSSPTRILSGKTNVSKIYIDNVEQPSVTTGYTFSTTGEHTIKYFLIDASIVSAGIFWNCSGLTSVNIPDSITNVSSSAFTNCVSLTSCTIGSGVTSIGYGAFIGCNAMTSITIPDNVTSISTYAFSGCSGLEYVIMESVTPPTLGSNVFASTSCEKLVPTCSVVDTYKETSGWSSYSHSIGALDCPIVTAKFNVTSTSSFTIISHSLSYVSLKIDGVEQRVTSGYKFPTTGEHTVTYVLGGTKITNQAFRGCSDMVSCTINSGVTSIGESAFSGCTNLTSVTIPDSVTSIGYAAFYYCTSLASVTIPDSVTSIGDETFRNCFSLTTIDIPDNVTSIGYEAFCWCSGLTSVTIPDNVTSIDVRAFSGCTNLTSITVNATTPPTLGTNAFNSNSCPIYVPTCSLIDTYKSANVWSNYSSRIGSLECQPITAKVNVTDTTSPTKILSQTPSITSVLIDGVVQPSVTTGYTFSTTGEHTIEYGLSGTSIGQSAFYNCSSLTSIVIPDSVTIINDYTFRGCSGLTSCTIGSGVTSIGKESFSGCTSLTSITIPDRVTSISGNAFTHCTSLSSITIPDSVARIGDGAFSSCTSVTSCTIGSGVTSIGDMAFNSCRSLRRLNSNVDGVFNIPDSVTIINESAFSNCINLISVNIPNSITSIGNSAFARCSGLTSIDIPDSVTSIYTDVFYNCTSLSSCTIGSGTTSIGNMAFQNCSSLTSIISNATTAPTIQSSTFQNVGAGGTLTVPIGSSGYDVWMGTGNYYLGLYNWTKVEQ